MARGWESKAVEDQVDARAARVEAGDNSATGLTNAERALRTQVNSLKLSRTRIMNQLASATNPAHRTMLERALAAIDGQINAAEQNDRD